MVTRTTVAVIGATALLFSVSTARADLLPPPDYVEQCTLARVTSAQPELECRACEVSRMASTVCPGQLQPLGYRRACKTIAGSRRGARKWQEVWCRPRGGSKPPPTAPSATPEAPDDATIADAGVETNPTTDAAPPADEPPAPARASSVAAPPPISSGPADAPPEPAPGPRGCGGCGVGSARAPVDSGWLGLALAALFRGLRHRRLSRQRDGGRQGR